MTLMVFLQNFQVFNCCSEKQTIFKHNFKSNMFVVFTVVSAVILIILFAVALFLINNTISMGIAVPNEEISIMRLLGARNGFIRAPFVVQGITIGVIGAGIPLLVLYFAYGNVINYVLRKFSFLSSILSFMPVEELYVSFVPIAALLGVGLGLLGSVISLSKHLKK